MKRAPNASIHSASPVFPELLARHVVWIRPLDADALIVHAVGAAVSGPEHAPLISLQPGLPQPLPFPGGDIYFNRPKLAER